MIKIETLDRIYNHTHFLTPTIFPDNTSQIWKLPEEIVNSLNVKITWNFEAERELIDILSFRVLLLKKCNVHLHIPYLPYARQDKEVQNSSTYNLYVFASILNMGKFNLVTSVDVHNPIQTKELIKNFTNLTINNLIEQSLKYIPTDGIVFPDYGAECRYSKFANNIFCCKVRNELTGVIEGHKIQARSFSIEKAKRVLIVDDICDGGATFISITKMLKEINPNLYIDLYVTHGIFSKGREILRKAGIENIYCTNSLLKNVDGFKV